jgi:DNA-binding IclR family transcriptional regulator
MAESLIRVITRAVKILDCFLSAGGSLGITELSRQTQLSKSTVHHVVSTLVETGLLAPDGTTRRYRLGPKVAQLGNAFIESTDLRELVLPSLTELRDLTDETVTLHAKVGDERVIMAQVVSTQGVRRVLEVGASRPLNLGAAGIVLMSDLSDQEVLRFLKRSRPKKLTGHTVTDPQKILALVQRTRVDGYCILSEQTVVGVGAIALPIHDHRGAVPASILISGPYQRWNPKTIAPYLKRMTTIAEAVSRRLGGRLNEATQAVQVASPRARAPRAVAQGAR